MVVVGHGQDPGDQQHGPACHPAPSCLTKWKLGGDGHQIKVQGLINTADHRERAGEIIVAGQQELHVMRPPWQLGVERRDPHAVVVHDHRRARGARANDESGRRTRHGFKTIAQGGSRQAHLFAGLFGTAGLATFAVAGQHPAGAAVDDLHNDGVGLVALGDARADEVTGRQGIGHGWVAGSVLATAQGLVSDFLLNILAAQNLEASC